MIKGIDHISLLISNEHCFDFYKILGFKEVFRKNRANDIIVLLEGFGIQLEIFIDSRHPNRFTDINEPLGCRHFALKVDNIENEVRRLSELMSAHGFEPQFQDIGNDWVGEKYVFFKDPDGNVVELHE